MTNTPIRMLLAISDLGGGGSEHQLSLLVHGMSRQHFEPHLCLWRRRFQYSVPEDLPVHWIRKEKPWHVLGAVRETRRLIDSLRPELVYSQLPYVSLVTGTALAGCRHQPRWVCRQTNNPHREMRGPFAFWAHRALRRADRVIGCSIGVARATVDHLRLDEEKVCVIDNLVDVDAVDRLAKEPLPISRSPDAFTIVHAGRLTRQKNQALLLKAFRRFRGLPAELWILGEGPLAGELRGQAERLGVASQVRWLGFRSNPYPFFRAADCLALSSDWEGLPNVLIESMLCGTPPVATRCPYGPNELIEDGVDGLLVPVGEAGRLADALQNLSHDPASVERMGETARRKSLERFDKNRVTEDYERLFVDVVRAAPGESEKAI